jgi:hypothetical protein
LSCLLLLITVCVNIRYMDIEEEGQVGFIIFKEQVELTPVQRRMAEGSDGKLILGIDHIIRLGRLPETPLEYFG